MRHPAADDQAGRANARHGLSTVIRRIASSLTPRSRSFGRNRSIR